MIRVVVDTNVVVSAALVEEGHSASILDLAANGLILMIVSAEILTEYNDLLQRPRLKLAPARIRAMLAVIRKTSKLVRPQRRLEISPDEADNRFYECAEAGKAGYLITGNAGHFPVDHKGTRVITPREFIEQVGSAISRRRK
jgi:putative PIN family toxin of toxin-antitoxin system